MARLLAVAESVLECESTWVSSPMGEDMESALGDLWGGRGAAGAGVVMASGRGVLTGVNTSS